jgi:hypothetical protein
MRGATLWRSTSAVPSVEPSSTTITSRFATGAASTLSITCSSVAASL